MIFKVCIFIILLFSGIPLLSQNDPNYPQFLRDSLEIKKLKHARPQLKFDNRIAFHGTQALEITGFDAGVLLDNKLRLTLGYYSLKGSLKEFDKTIGEEEFGRLIELEYGALNTELIYKDERFYALGMPLEVGAGVNTFRTENITSGQTIATKSGALLFVNFGLSGTFKPMRFLGLKVIVGYRKTVFNQVKDFNFDGFFTSIGLNVDVHEIVSDIKMYRLQKRYRRGNNISNAVNILTD